jgi:hypothetical protein
MPPESWPLQRLDEAQGEAIRHPGDVVHDVVDLVAASDQVVEDPPDGSARPRLLGSRRLAEVDALEHERAQREHGRADLLALADVTGARRGLDEIVDERIDPPRARRPQQLDLLTRQLLRVEHPGPHGVVDVVVDVRDPVDEPDDLALERVRLVRPRVVEDPVADLGGQVEPAALALEHVDDPERVLVVAEVPPEALLQSVVERLLTRVPERRVAEVVPEPDRLDEVLVQP